MGLAIYTFQGLLLSALQPDWNLVRYVLIAAVCLMIVAIIGCAAANKRPERKCTQALYLLLILLMFTAQVGIVVLECKKGWAVQKNYDDAKDDALGWMKDEVVTLYKKGNCEGGYLEPPDPQNPYPELTFKPVKSCQPGYQHAFDTILKKVPLTMHFIPQGSRFAHCMTSLTSWPIDPKSWRTLVQTEECTQVFCHGEQEFVDFVHKHAKCFQYTAIALAVLELILFVSDMCLLFRHRKKKRALLTDPNSQLQLGGSQGQQYQPYVA